MTGHIFIEGEIGIDCTPKSVRNDIDQYPGASKYIIHINSGGGDVYDGYQIGSIIKNLGKPSEAHIGAVCASIATYAACCCDSIFMSPHGDFMIHLPTAQGLTGNADDLRRTAQQLDRIKTELIDRYMTKVGKKGITREQLSEMIDKETTMSPEEAKKFGFIDDVREKFKAVAKIDLTKFSMKDEEKSRIDKLDKMIESFKSLFRNKIKNQMPLTLEDGTVIVVQTEDGTLQGKPIMLEDGSPLPAGTYTTVDGVTITVDENSTITEAAEKQMDNNDELNNKIKEQEAKIIELTEHLKVKDAESSKKIEEAVQARKDIETKFMAISKEFGELKLKAFGDPEPPNPGDPNRKQKGARDFDDPMASLGESFLTARNLR